MSQLFRSRLSVMQLLESVRPEPHHPMSAMIEIADRCNETCVHCYQVQGQKGELDTDSWRTILDELAEMGVLVLTISGGEATLRKDFLELVAYARQKSFAVKVYTNGLNMTRELANQLGALAVQEVQISLYSHRAEAHDAVTCVPGSFDKTVAAARYLREAGIPVVLKTPVMKANAGEVDEYIELVGSLGADFMMDPTVDPRENGDASPETLRVDDETFIETHKHPRLQLEKKRGRRPERPVDTMVCGACSGQVHIEANGEMRPCSALQVAVGHALEDGIQASFKHNEVARSIRETTWNDLPGCRECDLRRFCGRCFANARAEVGDALAPYPSACRKARLHFEVERGSAAEVVGSDARDIGPYRRVAEGVFECVAAPEVAADRGVFDSWVRPPGELVQLRLRTKRSAPSAAPIPRSED